MACTTQQVKFRVLGTPGQSNGFLPPASEISLIVEGDHSLDERAVCHIRDAIAGEFASASVSLEPIPVGPGTPLLLEEHTREASIHISEIEQIAALPSALTPKYVHEHPTPTGWHESILRSYQILGVVERLLEARISPVLIGYLISYMREAPCKEA